MAQRRMVWAMVALMAPALAGAAIDPIQMVPADYEVLMQLDGRKLVDSAPFQSWWAERETQKVKARLAIVTALTGVDPVKDLDRITFFSRLNDDDSVGLVVEGRLDPARLLVIVQASDTYKTTTVGGTTVHEWFDQGEKRTKFGAFPSEGTLAIWNSRGAMEASLGALAAPATSMAASPEIGRLPAAGDGVFCRAMAIDRRGGGPGARLQMESATMAMALTEDALRTTMTVTATSDEAGALWREMMEGARALAVLQRDKAGLAALAAGVTVEPGPDARTVIATGMVPLELLTQLARQHNGKK
jgi:hypothetical protein